MVQIKQRKQKRGIQNILFNDEKQNIRWADVPYFFKKLAMITDVTEDEWGTHKNPSIKLSKESTLRSYAKRGLTKKFAESIVYRLTPENFVKSLKMRPTTVPKLLADDYRSYDPSANADNIADLLENCFVDILREAVGLVAPNELKKQTMQQAAADLKGSMESFIYTKQIISAHSLDVEKPDVIK